MLEIVIPETELFDSETNCFTNVKQTKLQLEHSLLSISKWESRYKKPFLGDGENLQSMPIYEFIDYVKDMTITKNVDPDVYLAIISYPKIQAAIYEYMNDPMTATTFSNVSQHVGSKQVITAEVIYWEMTELNIPFECQKWHLNRLMTLIRVCSIKRGKPEKMSHKEMAAQRRALNRSRKAARHSRG